MSETSIFTKIRLGVIPGEIIYQDRDVFIIMTVAPHNPGHCMVIPVSEVANFEDLPSDQYLRVMDVARQMAQILKRTYDSPKIALAIVGMEVAHTHVHLFPLYHESEMNPDVATHPSMAEIQTEAAKLRVAIGESPIV